MKLSEKWLREYVDTDLTSEELAEQLTMAGFEVESVQSCVPGFDKVVVGRIEKLDTHPQANNLSVCEVNTGNGIQQVVCGAKNVIAGGCFPMALEGASLPGELTIGQTEIRGVTSKGMLCSAAELGLSDDAEKLLELDTDAEPGKTLVEHLGLDDKVFELSLTPNRGDCFSLRGIVRELIAINHLEPLGEILAHTPAAIDATRAIRLSASEACPRYSGRVIRGIDINRTAPDYIRERLRRADIRSINIIVDLTNYVMLETGQPMHAFDDDTLEGEISVRWSRAGEELTLLDGQQVSLQENSLLITDNDRPVGLAGIMGGLDTSVTQSTENLFLESAYFTPQALAGRARSYGLHTDASLRYERGVDTNLQVQAVERLTELILKYAEGQAGPLLVEESAVDLPAQHALELKISNVERLLGIAVSEERVCEILERLGFGVSAGQGSVKANVPSWRFDVSIEADLIEEVARMVGYDNIPSVRPLASLSMFGSRADDVLQSLQDCLMNRGYNEVITYSFVDQQVQDSILGPQPPLQLLNPISADLAVMRASLLPGLLKALSYNHKRQQERIRLFEFGRIFELKDSLQQDLVLGGIITGNINNKQWDREDISSDIFDIKSDVEALVRLAMGKNELDYREIEHPAFHPGQCARIFINNQAIGMLGAIHPGILKDLGLLRSAFAFEIDLSLMSGNRSIKFEKISKYPAVKRDISILLDEDITVASVAKSIKKVAEPLLSNLELFDLYQGEGIDLGKKSLALGLTFQTSSSTLTEEEVGSVIDRIVNTLHSEFGATLRD